MTSTNSLQTLLQMHVSMDDQHIFHSFNPDTKLQCDQHVCWKWLTSRRTSLVASCSRPVMISVVAAGRSRSQLFQHPRHVGMACCIMA